MISASNISLIYGERTLFKDVNIKFVPGNCYGLIGANGAGKSTFLKILSGEIESTTGTVDIPAKQRIAVLSQDQAAFDDFTVLNTVIRGDEPLANILEEREILYSKVDFGEAEGIRAAELESALAEMNGYEAESQAAMLLEGLDIPTAIHDRKMIDLEASQKVRVLLAQALFNTPDILLLDEPTNNLDIKSTRWLEEFLFNFENTVIVVSHDRHFLNNVCTHIADIDFKQIKLYVGNYEFWYMASQLANKQRQNASKKREDRIKELETFVRRFSANVKKARQATARRKMIAKLTVDDLPSTSRRFPYIDFSPERKCGRTILEVEKVNKTVDGERLLENFSMQVNRGDRIALVGPNDQVKTTLFNILAGADEPDSGEVRWGTTITSSYFPKNNDEFFARPLPLVDWLRQYTNSDDESYVRGFLGRMLFSGEEALKPSNVLSGGEKVRCMLSRMMLSGANVLLLDEPTNHLDLEAITALNDGLLAFDEVAIFTTVDHELVRTVANRIIEFTPNGVIDRMLSLEEYLEHERVVALRAEMYGDEKPFTL